MQASDLGSTGEPVPTTLAPVQLSAAKLPEVADQGRQRGVSHRFLHLHPSRLGTIDAALARNIRIVRAAMRQRPEGHGLRHAALRRRFGIAGCGDRQVAAIAAALLAHEKRSHALANAIVRSKEEHAAWRIAGRQAGLR